MLLSARILDNVSDVNHFSYDTEVEFTEGDAVDIYIQLIDASVEKADQGYFPSGRRYVAASGANLQVIVDSIDDAKKITRTCTQPFPSDGSIWKFSVLASDPIRGTATLRLSLTEGTKVTRGSLENAVVVSPKGVF